MHSLNSTNRRRQKAKSRLPDLFTWAREAELMRQPPVRTLMQRTGCSPAVALALAELAGLLREDR